MFRFLACYVCLLLLCVGLACFFLLVCRLLLFVMFWLSFPRFGLVCVFVCLDCVLWLCVVLLLVVVLFCFLYCQFGLFLLLYCVCSLSCFAFVCVFACFVCFLCCV